jgi:hypothetical protein
MEYEEMGITGSGESTKKGKESRIGLCDIFLELKIQ